MPRSSLAECSFTDPCEDPAETCNVSQVCFPPFEGQPSVCEEEKGDRRCHRKCDYGAACGSGESCSHVQRANRSDIIESDELCMQ
ncbi:hypothetical protein ACLESD_02285 [Pyxidicoccus sp. 3LFB2]